MSYGDYLMLYGPCCDCCLCGFRPITTRDFRPFKARGFRPIKTRGFRPIKTQTSLQKYKDLSSENIKTLHVASLALLLSRKRVTKVLTRLCGCAGLL